MWHYARGLAFGATGQMAQAMAEHDSLVAIEAASPADAMIGVGNSTKAVLHVASAILSGQLLAAQGKLDDAIASLQDAVKSQDGLRYDEPPIWYYPARHTLGRLLLKAGKAADAEAVYREDLRQNPGNGWSLNGLSQALAAKGDAAGAASAKKEFQKAWAKADVTPAASEF